MINMELPLYIGGKEYKAFLQPGFFDDHLTTKALHNHSMAEVHLQIAGHMDYRVGKKVFGLDPDTIMLVPNGVFHNPLNCEEGIRHIAYQVSIGDCTEKTVKLPSGTLERVWKLIRKSLETKCGEKLSAVLSQLCTELIDDGHGCKLVPVENREVIIRDFFSRYYDLDVTVNDLAAELSLSPKHTERLVKKMFGQTFGQKMMNQRIEVANQLIAMDTLSLAEVAEQVGYKSYSGFWKAYRRKS